MPAKITNPLMEGLPSKIYLCAFPAPKSRYQIAREIYDIPKGQIPPTAKVSNVVRDMLSEKYNGKKYLIKISEESILSDVAPLVAEMEKELKESEPQSIKITDTEKAELTSFLDKDFRKFISKRKKNLLDEGDSAYYILTDIIGSIVYHKKILLSVANIKEYKELMAVAFPEGEIDIMDDINPIQLSKNLVQKLEIFIPEEIIKTEKIIEKLMKGYFNLVDYVAKKNKDTQT